jgi:ABC-type amino acid transport substrate-binding protein
MRSVLISLLISILVAGAAFLWLRAHPESLAGAAKPENTYERILRTGEIRCGYSLWEPLFTIDPKTGEKRGIFYDLMEEAGKRLGFKIIWQEELGWGTIVESVISHRVDMACTAYWLNAGRLKSASSSVPQLYTPLYVWVRQDEARPFASPDDLNSPALTVTSIDGAADNQVIAERFAKAKRWLPGKRILRSWMKCPRMPISPTTPVKFATYFPGNQSLFSRPCCCCRRTIRA